MIPFKNIVPSEVQEKLLRIAESIEANFTDVITSGESYGCARMDVIHGMSYDGFIAFQDGGYTVSDLFRCDIDSTYHFNDTQTAYMNQQEKYMMEDFYNDAKVLSGTSYNDMTDEQQMKLQEYEQEYYEPALVSIELFVNMDDDIVTMRTEINYRDSPYYREKSNDMLAQNNLTIAEFLAMPDDEIINALKA